jgi:hypothetical protein
MKKLEHNMLLDAKQVEDLGLYDYFERFAVAREQDIEAMAYRGDSGPEGDRVFDEFIEALVACDVSANYEEKESTWGKGEGGKV